jgi:hypothetical protein
MKAFTIYSFLVVLVLSQSHVFSIPNPITEDTNIDVIADSLFVARDPDRPNLVAKHEETTSDLEKRGFRTCVSTALHLLSSSFLKARKLGYIAKKRLNL